MPRAATTSDAFNAVAEPRRREIIDLLAAEEYSVGDLVIKVGLPQPAISKHLGVLRKVGLVHVLRKGQHRLYSLNARELKPVHDWVKNYERFWDEHLDAIKEAAERKAREKAAKKLKQSENQPHS
jgi:DNA-binding transcriptional ArsR family regulator